jgi:TatA/E family protein of Tat protein translocase
MNFVILFLAGNPLIWLLVIVVVFLFFGASRLPHLARALGQSKRALRDGLADSSDDSGRSEKKEKPQAELSQIDDETLFQEASRRARLHNDNIRGSARK